MEKYLIHSNEPHLVDQERTYRAVKQIVESLGMAAGLTFSLDPYRVTEVYFKDSDKQGETNHLLGIIGNTYDPIEDFGMRQSVKYES